MKKLKLDDAFEFIRNGVNIRQTDGAGGYPITRIETIANGYVNKNKVGFAGIKEIDKYQGYVLQYGDILMSHINSEKHLGKSAVYLDDTDTVIHGMNLLGLRCKKELLDPKYAYYYFNSAFFKRKIPKITKKSVNQASFSVTDVKHLEITVPAMSIQKKIVKALDKAQELIDKRKEQITACDELIKSLFYHMFGDPISNSRNFQVKSLGHICKMKAGKSIKACEIFNDSKDGMYPCYGGNGVRGYVKEYMYDGAISLIGRQGALCGNVQLAKGKFFATEHAIVTQLKVKMNTIWLYIMLKELNLNRLASGAAQPGLNVSTLVPLDVIVPPIDLQNDFAQKVEKIEQQKQRLQQSLTELENNFNALMQRVFKGELF